VPNVPAQGLPWAEMMAFGLGLLRLSPDAFWGLTFPEFRAAARGLRGEAGLAEPLPRGAFTALMQRFPDHSIKGT
jgi:uncharacterized phage protein (TIGR02216 family)